MNNKLIFSIIFCVLLISFISAKVVIEPKELIINAQAGSNKTYNITIDSDANYVVTLYSSNPYIEIKPYQIITHAYKETFPITLEISKYIKSGNYNFTIEYYWDVEKVEKTCPSCSSGSSGGSTTIYKWRDKECENNESSSDETEECDGLCPIDFTETKEDKEIIFLCIIMLVSGIIGGIILNYIINKKVKEKEEWKNI